MSSLDGEVAKGDSFYHHNSLWQWQGILGEIPQKTQDRVELSPVLYYFSFCWSAVMDQSGVAYKTFLWWSIVKVK